MTLCGYIDRSTRHCVTSPRCRIELTECAPLPSVKPPDFVNRSGHEGARMRRAASGRLLPYNKRPSSAKSGHCCNGLVTILNPLLHSSTLGQKAALFSKDYMRLSRDFLRLTLSVTFT